jgi:hypothetical protein
MSHVSEELLESNPATPVIEPGALARCIDLCFDCAQACVACSDACLSEPDPRRLLRCVRLTTDCADICVVTGRVLSRSMFPDLDLIRKQIEACAIACHRCAEECEQHQAHHEHCRVCGATCRECLEACGQALRHLAHAAVPFPSARPRP